MQYSQTMVKMLAALLSTWVGVSSATATGANNPEFMRIGAPLVNDLKLTHATDYGLSTPIEALDGSHAIGVEFEAAGAQAAGTFAITAQASVLFGQQEPTPITIDIKPESPDNKVRVGSRRVIPVAIFGSADLDVTAINPRTIRLNGVDVMLVGKSDKSLCQQKDINGDTHEDLLCDVRTTGFKISEGEFKVILKAGTYNGESLLGEDRIKFVRN